MRNYTKSPTLMRLPPIEINRRVRLLKPTGMRGSVQSIGNRPSVKKHPIP